MAETEWRWHGSVWGFLDIVQWAFVFQRLAEENCPDMVDIIESPELVRKKAEEYGMTYFALTKEMLRNGITVHRFLDASDDGWQSEETEQDNQ